MMGNRIRRGRLGHDDGSRRSWRRHRRSAAQFDAALADTFRASLTQGLLVAGIAAVATAIGASLARERRIATPIHQLAQASHRIADGRYPSA